MVLQQTGFKNVTLKLLIMPRIAKIKIEDRKDKRGGGYSRRKFTTQEADAIRSEYAGGEGGLSQNQLAKKYGVSQPLMTQLLNGKTYKD